MSAPPNVGNIQNYLVYGGIAIATIDCMQRPDWDLPIFVFLFISFNFLRVALKFPKFLIQKTKIIFQETGPERKSCRAADFLDFPGHYLVLCLGKNLQRAWVSLHADQNPHDP